MALSVYQKHGARSLFAKRAADAIKEGNIDLAEEIYFAVVGENFAEHNRNQNDPWLIYCMPARILSHIDDKYWPEGEPLHSSDLSYYERLRRNAEQTYGGTWEIENEY